MALNWQLFSTKVTFDRQHNTETALTLRSSTTGIKCSLLIHFGEQLVWFYGTKKGAWHKSYPGHVLWCAAAGGRGHRALQAAESARRPQGEVAPDRTTTSQSLQSERSNPLPVAPGPHWENGCGGPRRGEPGGQVGPVTASCGQNKSQQ